MFKTLDYTPATHQLNQVLFDVKTTSIFAKVEDGNNGQKVIDLSGYEAVLNTRNRAVLDVVSKNYELVTNQEALDIGKRIFCELFPLVKEEDMIPYKVIASKNLTFCHIDLIHRNVRYDRWNQDAWLPFLRISNSYNRTFALSYELGFVRELCSNGFIFSKDSIHVKYHHIKGRTPLDLHVDVSKLRQYEIDFVNYLNNLNRFYVDPIYVFPLVLKATNQKFSIDNKGPEKVNYEIDRYNKTKRIIAELTSHYYRELNPTAYAVLNILTDFISHHRDYQTIPYFSSHLNNYYRMPSQWILDFTREIQKTDFNMENYLGTYTDYLK